MRKKDGLSVERILQLAKGREFEVHRYDDRSTNLRKKTRRMLNDGLLTVAFVTTSSRFYLAAQPKEVEAQP